MQNKIPSYFEGHKPISKNDLVERILEDFPNLKESSINVYLSKLKKQGILKNPTRGIYALKGKQEFYPVINAKLKRLFNKVKKDYPFIDFCAWNTIWLNDLMRHQPFKFYTILELDKDATQSVFYKLKDQGKQVFLEPDAETFELYIHNSDNVIIIKQLVSEAPLLETENVVIPSLEKLLVDMIVDTNLYAAQQGELDFIYQSAFDKFEVNQGKMKRYAQRRNREKEVEQRTNLTLANS
ncbi:DUF6577 family protein [Gramella sp. AN32]|uniref:DUF6577 family protein n=1 Tax=Christiangramia antarctica TaxID=2058158 RepID=A0ABW5XDG1_9FLAO|nr:DUF6577 family protein [Gramella sp. AN32]MCM4157606.1 hypothetical protein [Gramella sp. AN32]